jgi:hypothetical protein
MKYIITEEQHKRLIESNDKLVRMVQKSIDNIIDKMREECEEIDDFSAFRCKILTFTTNITVDEVYPGLYLSNNEEMISRIHLTFDTLSKGSDERYGHFFYEYLQEPLEQRFGLKFAVRYNVNKINE